MDIRHIQEAITKLDTDMRPFFQQKLEEILANITWLSGDQLSKHLEILRLEISEFKPSIPHFPRIRGGMINALKLCTMVQFLMMFPLLLYPNFISLFDLGEWVCSTDVSSTSLLR